MYIAHGWFVFLVGLFGLFPEAVEVASVRGLGERDCSCAARLLSAGETLQSLLCLPGPEAL